VQPTEAFVTKKLVVGICQNIAVEGADGNWALFETQVREAAARGATVVCSQELFTAPYFCQGQEHQHFDLAETIPGPSTARAQVLAKELGVVLVISLFEERAPGLTHNTAVVVESDGSILGTYRKMHIPQDPGFDEKFYFAPGDQGFKCFETSAGKIGVLICWDQWYPEAARLTALQGAEVIFYPTAIAWDDLEDPSLRPAQVDAWQTSMRAHAIANGVFVAAPNRIGREGRLVFWGNSFVCGPDGQFLSKTDHEAPEVLVVECDRERIRETRRVWPFLRDRRIDAYEGILKRFGNP
jgi:N-carbamoylputrescine amidase